MFNLSAGDTCTYKLNAKCGSPYFKVDEYVNEDNTTLQVSFIEYDWAKAPKYNCSVIEKSNKKKKCQPNDDLPPRDSVFDDVGN